MSAMGNMSRAIREELEKQGPTLKEIPTETLREYIQILFAFYLDMKEEYEQRPTP